MTNEECIRVLSAMKDELILSFDHDRKEALQIAIEALQAQMSESLKCRDTGKAFSDGLKAGIEAHG